LLLSRPIVTLDRRCHRHWKTVTLRVLAEQLSRADVPMFLPDVKGDLSGMARPQTSRPARHAAARREHAAELKNSYGNVSTASVAPFNAAF